MPMLVVVVAAFRLGAENFSSGRRTSLYWFSSSEMRMI